MPVDLIIEPILFLWNIIFTLYYTRVRPQCDFSILGREQVFCQCCSRQFRKSVRDVQSIYRVRQVPCVDAATGCNTPQHTKTRTFYDSGQPSAGAARINSERADVKLNLYMVRGSRKCRECVTPVTTGTVPALLAPIQEERWWCWIYIGFVGVAHVESS